MESRNDRRRALDDERGTFRSFVDNLGADQRRSPEKFRAPIEANRPRRRTKPIARRADRSQSSEAPIEANRPRRQSKPIARRADRSQSSEAPIEANRPRRRTNPAQRSPSLTGAGSAVLEESSKTIKSARPVFRAALSKSGHRGDMARSGGLVSLRVEGCLDDTLETRRNGEAKVIRSEIPETGRRLPWTGRSEGWWSAARSGC